MTTIFRRIAPSIWQSGADAAIYGSITVDLESFYEKNPEKRNRSPLPVLLFLMFQAARSIKEVQSVLVWKTYFKKRDFSFVIPIDSDSKDLRFYRLRPKADWTLKEFENFFAANEHSDFRKQSDSQMGWAFNILKVFPIFLIPWTLKLVSFLIYELSISPKIFGFRHEPFGPIVVTNFGSLGLRHAFAPLVPMCRNVVTVGLGQLQSRFVLNSEGKIQKRSFIDITFTVDHRYMDGSHCAEMFKNFKQATQQLLGPDAI